MDLPVGRVVKKSRLAESGRRSTLLGIAQAVVGNRLSDISHAVQQHAESYGFCGKGFCGARCGQADAEEPQIPNFGPPGRGPRLKEGMTLAIEPMINAGGYQVEVLQDNWTVVTRDGSWSVHFEHTVAITEDGPRILTSLQE